MRFKMERNYRLALVKNVPWTSPLYQAEALMCFLFSSYCWTVVSVVVEDQREAPRQWWPSIAFSFSVS